jgi:polyhydroxyalkanoate synthesis regulator phasin
MVLALVGSTGLITTIFAAWLKRGERKLDDTAKLVTDLFEQNKALLKRIDDERKYTDDMVAKLTAKIAALEIELDTSKRAGWILTADNVSLRAENAMQAAKIITMQSQIDALTERVEMLQGKRRQPVKPA